MRAFLHVDVAIAAVHFQLTRMNFVAEWHWLRGLIARIERQVVGGAQEHSPRIRTTRQGEHAEHRQEFISPTRK